MLNKVPFNTDNLLDLRIEGSARSRLEIMQKEMTLDWALEIQFLSGALVEEVMQIKCSCLVEEAEWKACGVHRSKLFHQNIVLTVRGVTAHFYNLCANGKSCVVNDKSIKGLLSLTDGGAPNLCASCTAATVFGIIASVPQVRVFNTTRQQIFALSAGSSL